ncbi:MAG: hypothetical protein ABI218_15940, partial [Caldimonas sp.]
LQLEVQLLKAHSATSIGDDDPAFMLFEGKVLRVHAHEDIVVGGSHHVNTDRWSPLLYVFRHYFGVGERVGRNFRAET